MQLLEKEGRHEGGNADWREGGKNEGIQLSILNMATIN